jgi:hypothetical protein
MGYEINWEDGEVNFFESCSSKCVKFKDVINAATAITTKEVKLELKRLSGK